MVGCNVRKVCYITGTRADYGLMEKALSQIHHSRLLQLSIIATGNHFSSRFGNTVQDIESAGLPVTARVEVNVEPPTGATMARNIGMMLVGIVDALAEISPRLVLLLGDRGEMLAGALAAVHLNIPVVHVHGGERSGTIDEPVRHAISKLAHYHFVATEQARQRLIRMGEREHSVYVTGAPGLDGLAALASVDRTTLAAELGLDSLKPVALLVYHPVLQEVATAAADVRSVLEVLRRRTMQVVALQPNSDAGNDRVREVLDHYAKEKDVRVVTHFRRERFVSWMAVADLMIGNSSAGIIEAATFGTPVINIGSRQNLRERNANVRDVEAAPDAIDIAVTDALARGRFDRHNIYGDGKASERIVELLARLDLQPAVLKKTNAY
jgi:GDP/UDP-N,N'-diacetylbacillosamine 2-epimerase (hydrolysing)